ncbi:MAG TPA: PDZ domain-containing protein [Terriglobales bacterium]|nr:PDZ domain-containing protein [Terriglobales bacterium]
MKRKTQILAIAALFLAATGMPAKVGAEPEGQHYVFYGDESGGGGSYLGVDTRDITTDRMADLHVKDESGVEVTMVDQDAPAGKAGLREHDVILSINDQKIESVEQLRRVVHEIPPGRSVTIGISRAGQPMTLKAQLAERNMDRSFNFSMPPINIPAIHIPPINMPEIDVPTVVVMHSPHNSGMMVENLTPQLGEFFGVKSANGVLIRSVERGSRAEQAGFRAGDVIVKVDGSGVSDCSDFTRLLRERKGTKAAVTVMRDRKEQNLTLTLPEPRRSGSLKDCDYAEAATCAQFINEGTKVARAIPEFSTADIKRLQPQMEQLQKQIEEEMENPSQEVKEDLEQLRQDLSDRQKELQRQIEHCVKESDI